MGGMNAVGGQVASFGIKMIGLAIMARLLSPTEFGIVTMVTSITGIIELVKDLGLSTAIIQREKIYQSQVSALFWVNSTIGVLLGVIIALSGFFMVSFYHEPKLLKIAYAFGISIFISVLSAQHMALMKRQMKFKLLSLISIVSTIIASLLGVISAYLHLSYWSVVILNISSPVIQTILLWILCDWRPGKISFRGVRRFIEFGFGVTGFNLINYFSRNLDNILIGRQFGSVSLGLYAKAYQLLLLPLNQLRNPLNSVGIPSLSALQNNSEKYKSYIRKFIFLLAAFSMPIVAIMFVFSDEIIFIVLGKQWGESAKIFKALAIVSFIQPVASVRGVVLLSLGQSNRYLIFGLINAFFVVTSFLIGIHWGIYGLIYAYTIINYIILFPTLLFCFKGSPIKPVDFFEEIFVPAISAILMVVCIQALNNYVLDGINIFIKLICGGVFGMVVYIGLWFILPGGKGKYYQVTELVKGLLEKIKRK